MDDVVGKSEITNVFYNKYSNIYSEFKDDEKMIVKLNQKISNECCFDKYDSSHYIDNKDVIMAVNSLKSNKYEPIYDMSSNCFKYGTNLLFYKISVLFNLMLIHGVSTSKFNRA